MGILERIRRLVGANLHEALDRAEQPVSMLNYLIIEMQEGLEQARDEVATAIAAERRLLEQAREAEAAEGQWLHRARRALEYGDELLAREALRRKLAAEEMAEQYRRAYSDQAGQVAQLREELHRLEMRCAEARARRTALLASASATQARTMVGRTWRGTVGEDAFSAFDRIAGQIATERHRASALAELTRDDGDDAFLVAEEGVRIDAELRQLHEELRALPEGERRALEDQRP